MKSEAVEDSYHELLDSEMAKKINDEHMTWRDLSGEIIERTGISSIAGHGRSYVIIPDKQKIKMWHSLNYNKRDYIKKNVEPKRQNLSGKFCLMGYDLSARQISDISGLATNTIYKYWQRANHEIEAFEAMLASKMSEEQIAEYMKNANNIRDCEDDVAIDFA